MKVCVCMWNDVESCRDQEREGGGEGERGGGTDSQTESACTCQRA